MTSFDEVLNEIGGFGKYQAFLVLACLWSMIPIACNISAVVFLGFEEDYICNSSKVKQANQIENFFNETTIPSLPSDLHVEQNNSTRKLWSCSYISLPSDNKTFLTTNNKSPGGVSYVNNTDCPWGFIHHRDVFQQTIRTEWDLVCSNNHLNSLSTALFCLGMLIGSTFGGALADKYGRIRTMVGGTLLNVIFSISCSFSPNFIAFVSLRCFIGIFSVVVQIAMATYTVEIVGKRWRSGIGLLLGVFSGLGYMTLSLIAFYIRHWRTIQLVLGVIHIPFLIASPFIPESPRLLVTHGKITEAKKICMKIADHNKCRLDESSWEKFNKNFQSQQKQKSFTFLKFLKSSILMRLLGKNMVLWFVNGLIFFCLSFNVGHWSGNPFLNNALSGLVEVVACLVIVPIINKIGRRNTIVTSLVIAGLALSACEILKFFTTQTNLGIIEILLLLIAKFAISGTFNMLFLYAAELFPTEARNTALGISTIGGRSASIVAPFLLELHHVASWVLSLVLVLSAVGAAGVAFQCPETKEAKLLSTVDEAESYYSKRNHKVLLNNNVDDFTPDISDATMPTENLLQEPA